MDIHTEILYIHVLCITSTLAEVNYLALKLTSMLSCLVLN